MNVTAYKHVQLVIQEFPHLLEYTMYWCCFGTMTPNEPRDLCRDEATGIVMARVDTHGPIYTLLLGPSYPPFTLALFPSIA